MLYAVIDAPWFDGAVQEIMTLVFELVVVTVAV
jgi:hypothetical protein